MTENLINRITYHLSSGGLFNPELADHLAVRNLLMECREALAQPEQEPKFEINSARTVAVDREYYWQPMDTCPRGVKVQLLGAGGVAVYGQYHGKDPWWTHWAPLPVKPKENTDAA